MPNDKKGTRMLGSKLGAQSQTKEKKLGVFLHSQHCNIGGMIANDTLCLHLRKFKTRGHRNARIDRIEKKLADGQVITRDDMEVVTNNAINTTLESLRFRGCDLVTLKQGNAVLGWCLKSTVFDKPKGK